MTPLSVGSTSNGCEGSGEGTALLRCTRGFLSPCSYPLSILSAGVCPLARDSVPRMRYKRTNRRRAEGALLPGANMQQAPTAGNLPE